MKKRYTYDDEVKAALEGFYTADGKPADTRISQELYRILHEESILRAVNYDSLTGLPNVGYFFKLCENGETGVHADGRQGCLLYMDLNGMKYYNHRNGYSEGDKLLKAYAEHLAQTFGHENCCHIGADRFAAYAAEDGLEDRLQHFFDEVRQMENHLSVRVGIYPTSLEEVSITTAYDRAKMACDVIRKSETSSFRYYTKELSDNNKRRRYIQSSIDKAIAEKWIQVYYQPIVRAVNGRVCDEEALARWIDPEMGFLSPAEFIPELEESDQIYKLDLYVLEQVLEKLSHQKDKGLETVPHSINLSRSDFDTCDIVEEIRTRVDAAGISHDLITIEITESVIGSSVDFMKDHVERFRQLGFPVWMDDFGSGYSSLNVLQSIRFDLIKFDMSFLRRLDEGSGGKIILTDLMKMATSLGVDTVCEGVETEDQVRFLQEIGCSKLQGFYYCRPIPLEEIIDRYRKGTQIGFENPDESSYYETIGRINLYDLEIMDSEKETALQHAYNTLPMAIMEIMGDYGRYVRSSQSYRDFMLHFFGFNVREDRVTFTGTPVVGPAFVKAVRQCCHEGERTFFDEIMPDGSKVHVFVRRIGSNPVTGCIAIAVAVLSIREPNEGLMVEEILSVIEQFGEHMPGGFFIYKANERGELLYANKAVCDIYGCGSMEEFREYTGFTFRGMVHPEDYEKVISSIKEQKKNSLDDLDFVEYRIIRKDGAVRWIGDYGHYVEYDDYSSLYYIFISDITDKHEQTESDKALYSAVIEALTRQYDSVWLINDMESEKFELFRIDKEMEHLMPANMAVKIENYSQAFRFYSKLIVEEDRQRFLESVTSESIVRNTEKRPIYSVPFRRIFEDGIRNYRLEFVRLDLPGGKTGIVGGFRNADKVTYREQD